MRRIEEEKRTVALMVSLYCRRKEGNAELCENCAEVLNYALRRLEACRYGDGKPTCRRCPIHCYRPDMKDRVKEIMRWAGPRMTIYHPLAAVRHMIRELKSGLKRHGSKP